MIEKLANNEAKARASAREIVKNSVGADQWQRNEQVTLELQQMIAEHNLTRHPARDVLTSASIPPEAQQLIHLEFAYAFSQPFSDLLLNTMSSTRQLEDRLGPQGHMAARFLLGLNLLEELGYTLEGPGSSPLHAHYVELLSTMDALGITAEERAKFRPCNETKAIRMTMEKAAGDIVSQTTLLAVTETIFPQFASLWANSVHEGMGVDTTRGFHAIHVDDEEGFNIEEDHAGDGWCVLTQVLTDGEHDRARRVTREWLDQINNYLDVMVEYTQQLVG